MFSKSEMLLSDVLYVGTVILVWYSSGTCEYHLIQIASLMFSTELKTSLKTTTYKLCCTNL